MPGNVKAIPEGHEGLMPYLYLNGAAKAIEFYKKAFGAEELYRMPGPNDTVGHSELKFRDSIVMLADWEEGTHEMPTRGASFLRYVEDVDSAFKQAIDAGATVQDPLENKFYGDRMGGLLDPFGIVWFLGTRIEDVSPAEMQKRVTAAMSQMGT